MYALPPIELTVVVQTNAVGGTNQVNALIAAPGAGLAVRLVGYQVSREFTGTGALQAILQDGVSGGEILRHVWEAGRLQAQGWPIPEPGVSLPVNHGLSLSNIAGVASQFIVVTMLYFVDAV